MCLVLILLNRVLFGMGVVELLIGVELHFH